MRDYFYGVMREFSPFSVLVDLADVQLVQVEMTTLSAGMLPLGKELAMYTSHHSHVQEAQKSTDFVVGALVSGLSHRCAAG